ncbi:hypothetical protein K435DRAFT_964622 [Dendrothele bispora CBS 962.96]|uniref:Zn(2)-C6 fungal-type domain-containing protein n=1 Tax=Dendrothele bispora (strain CBS 962.96) TaxID=1314807 RepID=A0A4S8MAE4_DENBC|nr:hypothetical protein K435DRAFT_964622 [Dendrothele bispora CBS 962.96]
MSVPSANTKRKRLSKACDGCHRSKRRCDGTNPCGNCYFASKICTYTDSSGRPVPAPRTASTPQQPSVPYTQSNQFHSSFVHQQDLSAVRKRRRPDEPGLTLTLEPSLTRELTNLFLTHDHPALSIIHKPSFTNALSLNQVPLHLLYAMCAMAARHSKQPSISTGRFSGRQFAEEAVRLMFDDGHGEGRLIVPPTYQTAQALCILMIHEILGTQQRPHGGKENDTSDSAPTPAVHSADQTSFSREERFRNITLQLLQTLGAHSPEHPLLTPVPSQHYIEVSIERECIRRIFWVIYVVDCMRGIYYKREGNMLGGSGRGYSGLGSPSSIYASSVKPSPPATLSSYSGISGSGTSLEPSTSRQTLSNPYPVPSPPSVSPPGTSEWNMAILMGNGGIAGFSEADLRLRLPADETSFEMGVVHEILPEYLHLAPTRAQSPSELAHMIRILTIYSKVEWNLDYIVDSLPHIRGQARYTLNECEKLMLAWVESLPQELRFTDQNLSVQRSMLETSSNTGAWCFALTHVLHASCVLALGIYNRYVAVESGKDYGPISDIVRTKTEEMQWASSVFDAILEMLGERARNSIILGAVLWPIIRYTSREDKKVQQLLEYFEDFTGVRMDQVAGAKWSPEAPSTINDGSGRHDQQSSSNLELPLLSTGAGPASMSSILVNGHGGALGPSSQLYGKNYDAGDAQSCLPSSSRMESRQNQNSSNCLPSLKSSGLLDWNNDGNSSWPSPSGPSLSNVSMPSGYSPISLSDATTSATAPLQSTQVHSPVQTSNVDGAQTGGRVGLSWMMNG